MSNRIAGLTVRLAILLAAAGAVLFLLLGSGAGAGTALSPTEIHVVRSGETLWSIAESLVPASEDTRQMVQNLKRLNKLEGGLIAVGQQLMVPAL